MQEMVGQFREQGLHYFRPYEPEHRATWDKFWQEFQDTLEELQQAPQHLEPLTGKELQDFALWWSNSKAGGLDGMASSRFEASPQDFL